MLSNFGMWPPSEGPFAWIPEEWDHGTTDPFAELLDQGDATLTYLLVASPFDPQKQGEALGLAAPFAFQPLAWGPAFGYLGATQDVYLADRSYTSRSGDTPKNQPFPAVLAPAYSIFGALGTLDDPIGDAEVSLGDIAIRNGEGNHDDLVNYSWGGRLLEIRAGDGDWPLSSFATILRGTVAGIRWGEESIHLLPALRTALFDQFILRTYYAGTGGKEGPAEIAGQPVPMALGRCRQLPMVQLDAAKQIWQVAETVEAFLAVRDIALDVTDSTDDYADYAALAAATVPSGQYATCIAEGLVRFGSDVTVPTVDVDGDPDAGSTVPDIIRWLVTTRLPPGAVLADTEIEGGSFNEAEADRGWTAGLHIAGEMPVRDAVQVLTRSIAAFSTPTRSGRLALGMFSLPGNPTAFLTAADVDDAGLELDAILPPVGKVTVGYRPNWRPLTDGEISETATDREAFRLAARTVSASATLQQLNAVDYRIDTTLDSETDAEELAEILVTMLSRATQRYRVPLRTLSLQYWLGDMVRLTYPRFGLDDGWDALVAGIDESSDGSRSLILLGEPPAKRYRSAEAAEATFVYGFDFTPATMPAGASLTRPTADHDGTYFDSAGMLQAASANEARFTYDPATLELEGLLNEPERTNIGKSSGNLYDWRRTNLGDWIYTENYGVAPDGTTASTRFQVNTEEFVNNSVLFGFASGPGAIAGVNPGGKSFAVSYWIKGFLNSTSSNSTVMVTDTGASWPANWFFGPRIATGGGFTWPDWTRLVAVGTVGTTSPSDGLGVGLLSGGPTMEDDCDAEFWGVQVEEVDSEDDLPSSYIPTTSAAATRSRDTLVLSVPDGTYDVVITRLDGTEELTGQVVSGGNGYTVPTSVSPLRSVTLGLSA